MPHNFASSSAAQASFNKQRDIPSERSFDPLGITAIDNAHCLLAYCHLRQDYRSFRLDRMRDLVVSEDSFRPNRVPMLQEFIERIRNDPFASANTRTLFS